MSKRSMYLRDYKRKQEEEKSRLRRYRRAMRKRERIRNRALFLNRLKQFLANPLKRKELNPDKVLRRNARRYARIMKRKEQLKWLKAFLQNPMHTLFKRKKDEEEILIEQWSKVDRKVAYRKRLANMQDAFVKILKIREIRGRFGSTLLQSTTYFILSFLLFYIIYQLSTIIVAHLFNIPVVWYYYRVEFPLYTFSPLYTRRALVVIFGIGPILSLIIGLISLRLFFSKGSISANLKLFYLWSFINGINFFFGSYISGFITRAEFIYTSEWLFMSSMYDVEEIVFVTLSIVLLLLVGRLVTPLFLITSNSVTIITPGFRSFFIFSQVIFPWTIGVVIIFLITTPNYYFPLIIKTITPGFALIPTLFLHSSKFNENIHTSGLIRRTYFRWGVFIVVVALLFFYRLILNFGLRVF